MSREIKYRVKVTWCDEVRIARVADMGFGKWIEGAVIGKAFFDLSSYSTEEVYFETSPATGDVLMQYTGLKDKNGVEIYEGDIVSFMFLKTKVERKRGVVVFDVDELCYFIRTSSEWGYNHNLAWCDTEVIGNIYENPELLEVINEQGND